jgi:hypothetical protein
MMDYEHARGLIFARPSWVMIPESIPPSAIPIARHRVLQYPGIKEDIYVPDFTPNPAMRSELGIGQNEVMVTIRPPANEAHYHNPASDTMFEAVLQVLSGRLDVRMILLPRNHSQGVDIRNRWPKLFASEKAIIPEHAVNGLNLIWSSDLVISGGGTMNREAAALRVPVYSIFRGKLGAVDRYLAAQNRLVLLKTTEDIRTKLFIHPRPVDVTPELDAANTLRTVVDRIVDIATSNALAAGCFPQYKNRRVLTKS